MKKNENILNLDWSAKVVAADMDEIRFGSSGEDVIHD